MDGPSTKQLKLRSNLGAYGQQYYLAIIVVNAQRLYMTLVYFWGNPELWTA